MTDTTGEARCFELLCIAADIKEDMILGSEWMFDARISWRVGTQIFYWKGNYQTKATTSSNSKSM